MNILALEFSSPGASIALLRDQERLGEVSWQGKQVASQPLFEHVPVLMREHGLSFGELDYIAVGRGPGNYTGLRVSLAAAQALALPSDCQIYSLSSGEALAYALGREMGKISLAVVGDARRQSCWFGLFDVEEGRVEVAQAWRLCPVAELPQKLPASAYVASPEYSRLSAQIEFDPEKELNWLPGDRFPAAASVGQCAYDRIERGIPPEPPQPLYMHPAVAVKS